MHYMRTGILRECPFHAMLSSALIHKQQRSPFSYTIISANLNSKPSRQRTGVGTAKRDPAVVCSQIVRIRNLLTDVSKVGQSVEIQ